MKRFVNDFPNGMPFTLNDLRFMQKAWEEGFEQLVAALAGYDKPTFIISGCERSNSSPNYIRAEGWVVYKGEVCYHPEETYTQHALKEHFSLETVYDPEGLKEYADLVQHDTYEIRQVKTSTVASVPVDEVDLDLIDEAADVVGSIPAGTITMWAGDITKKPNGYLLCDGTPYGETQYPKLAELFPVSFGFFNVPDLRGRFVVGYDTGDTDYDTLGETGGEKENTISESQLPAHKHNVAIGVNTTGISINNGGSHNHSNGSNNVYEGGSAPGTAVGDSGSRMKYGAFATSGDHNHSITDNGHAHSATEDSIGNGDAVENRPPYYTIAYLIKT